MGSPVESINPPTWERQSLKQGTASCKSKERGERRTGRTRLVWTRHAISYCRNHNGMKWAYNGKEHDDDQHFPSPNKWHCWFVDKHLCPSVMLKCSFFLTVRNGGHEAETADRVPLQFHILNTSNTSLTMVKLLIIT